MRCNDIHDRLDDLWEGRETAEVRQHLTQCAACARDRRDLRLVRAGFRLWKREEAVKPSVGICRPAGAPARRGEQGAQLGGFLRTSG